MSILRNTFINFNIHFSNKNYYFF